MLRPRWYEKLRRGWLLYHLAEPDFAFMFDPEPRDEWVAIDCETTGLDVSRDQVVAIGAVRIAGNRVLTSQRLELLVRPERKLSAASVRVHMLRERDRSVSGSGRRRVVESAALDRRARPGDARSQEGRHLSAGARRAQLRARAAYRRHQHARAA